MSDLQDLIHRNAQLAFEQGAKTERERIVKLMEEEVRYDFPPIIEMSLDSFIKLIKGEQK